MIVRPSFLWQQQTDGDLKIKDWIHYDDDAPHATMLGIPFARASISASGASEFPNAFRRTWDLFTPYYVDEAIDFSTYRLCDIGDVLLHATDVTQSHAMIEKAMMHVIERYNQSMYTTIGGDHSITAPLVRALKRAHPTKTIGIIQLDTHFDLRDFSQGRTNGTPIRQLVEENIVEGRHVVNIGPHGFYNTKSLIDAAQTYGVNIIPLKKMRTLGITQTIADAFSLLDVDLVYVTVDVDVLDIAYAPGVPAATPGGMRSDELFALLFEIGQRDVAAIDFVCIDPLRDVAQMTVKAAAYAYFTFIAAQQKRETD